MNRSIVPAIVISCVVILMCCCCLLILITTGIVSNLTLLEWDSRPQVVANQPAVTPVFIEPTPPVSPKVESIITGSNETLETLQNTDVPINDYLDLAQRLEGAVNIPVSLNPVAESLQVGTLESFWVTDTDIDANFQIDATLAYVTEHAYFWIEDGIHYREKDLIRLADTFENQIYPTNRAIFGTEWSPGVDGDPHLYIVYARGLGESIAGYFSSANEVHPLAHEYSNMHEIFMLSADNLEFDDEYTYGVLAHEFQHMIHWFQDRNEATWINEGLSELAAFINGYDVGGFDFLYVRDPDIQLNHWPNDPGATVPHYGASFLFVDYIYDRFGTEAIQELVSHQGNGMASVDDVLRGLNIQDGYKGRSLDGDGVFMDWVLANYIMDPSIFDGRYTYNNYENAPLAMDTETFRSCPVGVTSRTVHQYGVDYIRFKCSGDYTLRFDGSDEVSVVPVNPHSGDYAFWSNIGDDSDMTLTQSFDFREVAGPLTLSYWTWYDLEEDYDYVYLTVSLDGHSWQIITTPSGTGNDPSGNSFGWGYNGLSGGDGHWILEEIDLSKFAGKQIQIQFEYVTDAAVNGEGFLIDDIAIPEIGYTEDFETGPEGWETAGFVRIKNVLPQTFRLALIERGETTKVSYIKLGPENSIEIPIHNAGWRDDAVLVVTGTTRFTRQQANYQYQILP